MHTWVPPDASDSLLSAATGASVAALILNAPTAAPLLCLLLVTPFLDEPRPEHACDR